MNNLPKVVAQQRRGRASNPRLLDRKSDALPLSHRATTVAVIEILIKFLESRVAVFSSHTNVTKITIPKNGGHFERRAAIGWRNTPLNSYVAVSNIV